MATRTKKFLNKGGLAVGLVVTDQALTRDLPLDSEKLLTSEGGQVLGLGKAAVNRILSAHGIEKPLSEEAGRTNRGSVGLMRSYVDVLNSLHCSGDLDLSAAMAWWVHRVEEHFARSGPRFRFDKSKSVEAALISLFEQAEEAQSKGGGANFVGALLQHLVGAKLDLVLGAGTIRHHCASTADVQTGRNGDFETSGTVIHVTTHPGEALFRKISDNLADGLRPVIVTTPEGAQLSRLSLRDSPIAHRVDTIDIRQFLVANVYERSFLKAEECAATLERIIFRYNEIVDEVERDPQLRIQMPRR